MKIIQYVKALLPHIEKSKLLDDLRVTISELENVALPNYNVASTYFKSEKIKSDLNKEISNEFYLKAELKTAKQSSFIADIFKKLENVKSNSEYLLEQAEELFEHNIIAEGLTARKLSLVKAAESISFISRFSTDLLNLVYTNEATNVDSNVDESLRLPPIVVTNINKNISNFTRLLCDYGVPTDTFKKLFSNIPEVIVNSKTANTISGIYKESDIDPFSNSLVVGFTGNPIYHIRLMVAEWQASRFKANKDKKKILELRLLHLKLINNKKNDPKLEQEINYIQNRVDKIERYLKDVEESLNKGE
jgi:hypothetical protein